MPDGCAARSARPRHALYCSRRAARGRTYYFTRKSSEALRAVISASKTTSSAMVSKWSTILLWPCARAYSNALTNQTKVTASPSTPAFVSNQAPFVIGVSAPLLRVSARTTKRYAHFGPSVLWGTSHGGGIG